MTPYDNRTVRPIPQDLLALVPAPTDNNITIKKTSPDVEKDTMPLIVSKVKRTAWQTKRLAAKLQGASLAATLKNDCDFILKYIAYKQDVADHEQVRSPRRLVHDAQGDCDCFAVFLATLLLNQKIQFRFRLAQYANSGGEWTHIYIVVPKDQSFKGSLTDSSQYYTLDAVTNQYNYEVPFTKKRDVTMALQFLDGIGSRSARSIGRLGACTTEQSVTPFTLRKFVDTDLVVQSGMVPTKEMLEQNNYLFEQRVDEQSNSGYFVVFTPTGMVNVATVLTKEEAAQLQAVMSTPPSTQPSMPSTTPPNASIAPATATEKAAPSTGWFGYVMTAIGIASSMKNPGSQLVAGLPAARRTYKRSKHPVVNI